MSKIHDPRAVGGSNSAPMGVDAIDENKLTALLRQLAAAYNGAVLRRRHAAEKMRDEKRDLKTRETEVFDTIEAIRKSALEKMKIKLRERPAYVAAEKEKIEAAAEVREATTLAKENGIDVAAFKMALRLEQLDIVERQEHFDNIDIYAKCLKLWGSPD